jgi:predicted lipoprotein with Yx(FWY)xxD motif
MKAPLVACLLVLSINLHPDLSHAGWSVDGNVISNAVNLQGSAKMVTDGAGGAIIVWSDDRNGNTDIYAQRVDAAGVVQWAPNGVPLCLAAFTQSFPAIIPDGAGGAIVTWQDFRSGTTYDLYALRVTAAGAVQWGGNGVVISTSSGNQTNPSMIEDGAGGAIIAWQDDRLGNSDILTQRVNSSGVVQWPIAGVFICNASNEQINPTLTTDGASGAIIAWQDGRFPTNIDIYARRVDSGGFVLWTANGNVICSAVGHQFSPLTVSDGAGGAVITWSDGRVSTPVTDIYAQRVNNAGSLQWAANGVALCTAGNDQFVQMVTTDGAGGVIAAWRDRRSGAFDVYARRIDVTGTALWSPDGVAICTASDEQGLPAIVADGSGGAVVTWPDNRIPAHAFDIYAQRINSTGAVQWTGDGVALCTAAKNQSSPAIAADGSGGAIVAWQDLRNGNVNNDNDDIYAQHVPGDGVIPTAVGSMTPAASLSVGASYPNPFSAQTSFDMTLRNDSAVSAEVFDVAGRRVRAIAMGRMHAGAARLIFDGRDNDGRPLPSGVYFLRVRAASGTAMRKLVIAR